MFIEAAGSITEAHAAWRLIPAFVVEVFARLSCCNLIKGFSFPTTPFVNPALSFPCSRL
jgi:hypothetical protein